MHSWCRLVAWWLLQVYRGVFKDRQVAVKVCKHKQVNKRAMDLFKKEVTILHNCRHPNIVSFIGACTWQVHIPSLTFAPPPQGCPEL